MKIKKKTAVIAGFLAGAMLFTTTALADIANKSGYEQFKAAVKKTTADCSEVFNNYQVDFSYSLKDNGTELSYENSSQKYDRINNISENTGSSKDSKGQSHTSYYYREKNKMIGKGSDSETYYVTEFTEGNGTIMEDPFKQEEAEDIEKIADAVIGNLKDYVVVEEKADGSKEFSGSLQETQIPALVNAVASLQVKQMGQSRAEMLMPRLTKDIYVKEVTGNAAVNQDGTIEKVTATGKLCGTEEDGKVHELTLEVLVKISGINTTTVQAPDLTGKKVEKTSANSTESVKTAPQKYLGQYTNDIVIEKDQKFVKIGQRILEITDINQQSVSGKYREEYRQGYEEYASQTISEFSFVANYGEDKNDSTARFEAVQKDGSKLEGDLFFNSGSSQCYFNLHNRMGRNYDSQYRMVLE